MIRALDRIANRLRALGRTTLIEQLQPGLEARAVRDGLESLGLPAPLKYVELYQWHNGTTVRPGELLDDVHFFPGFYFLSLDEALANYRTFVKDSRWRRGWIPMFANGGGDFYVADLSIASEIDAPIVGFMVDEAEQPVEYEGVASMVATLDACFEEGVFYVDQRGYLDMDDTLHARITRQYNRTLTSESG